LRKNEIQGKWSSNFCCNDCKKIAGMSPSEEDALRAARDVSAKYGWIWQHPGWQIYCPNCKRHAK